MVEPHTYFFGRAWIVQILGNGDVSLGQLSFPDNDIKNGIELYDFGNSELSISMILV